MMADRDLIVHLARFAGELRGAGAGIGIGDEVDAANAVTLIDVSDRDEVRRALRVAFKIRHRDWPLFDALFDRFWLGSARETHDRSAHRPITSPPVSGRLAGSSGIEARSSPASSSPSAASSPGYTPDEVLRRKPFDECSDDDLAAMEAMLERLARALPSRPSRRRVPSRRRETADLRRSFRRAVDTGGELVSLAYRARAIERPRLVVLCDTSGSMDRHARFLLAFVVALRRVARSTEIFVFNTSLRRVTGSIASARIARAVDRLVASVPDWSGGTRIGESLNEFVAKHLDRFVTHKSIVVVFSDGLDRGDTTLIADAMRAIRSRARRVIWLNPLAGDSRYEPTARAMAAARPFIDRLAAAHDFESFERVLPELAR